MELQDQFLPSILGDLGSRFPWYVLADYLEERGDSRGELLRIQLGLTARIEFDERPHLEHRMQQLTRCVSPANPIIYNSIGMAFAIVPPGVFMMGATEAEVG